MCNSRSLRSGFSASAAVLPLPSHGRNGSEPSIDGRRIQAFPAAHIAHGGGGFPAVGAVSSVAAQAREQQQLVRPQQRHDDGYDTIPFATTKNDRSSK